MNSEKISDDRGIIYCMETVVDGLVKIGKTSSDQYEQRMYFLENNGYRNIPGLRRFFAVEVEQYDRKEKLLHNTYSYCRVGTTELFAVSSGIVMELMSAMGGKIVYPPQMSQAQALNRAARQIQEEADEKLIPDGLFYLNMKRKDFGLVSAVMRVDDHVFTVLSGSIYCPVTSMANPPMARKMAKTENNRLIEDVECSSPSTAASVVTGASADGWLVWKDKDGRPLSEYRQRPNCVVPGT